MYKDVQLRQDTVSPQSPSDLFVFCRVLGSKLSQSFLLFDSGVCKSAFELAESENTTE